MATPFSFTPSLLLSVSGGGTPGTLRVARPTLRLSFARSLRLSVFVAVGRCSSAAADPTLRNFRPPQQNSWVNFGSGRAPRV
jgi:hypothetical protein